MEWWDTPVGSKHPTKGIMEMEAAVPLGEALF